MRTIFFVTGYKGSGKDSVVGEALCRVYGHKKSSCSEIIAADMVKGWAQLIEDLRFDEVVHTTGKRPTVDNTKWLAEQLARFLNSMPKDPLPGTDGCARDYMIAHGDSGAYEDTTCWIMACIANGCDIITGVRRRSEWYAARTKLLEDGIRVVTIWCDRVGYTPKGTDNLSLNEQDADVVIRVHTKSVEESMRKTTDLIYVEKYVIENPTSKKEYHVR